MPSSRSLFVLRGGLTRVGLRHWEGSCPDALCTPGDELSREQMVTKRQSVKSPALGVGPLRASEDTLSALKS